MTENYEYYSDDYYLAAAAIEPEYYRGDDDTFAQAEEIKTISPTNYALFVGAAAFISRLGFLLVQVGSIPVARVNTIILYNVIEIAVTIVSYCMTGYMFAFGEGSAAGWIGFSEPSITYEHMDLAAVGFAASLIATGQISTYLVGRIHIVSGLLITFFYCFLYQPLLMHWIWRDDGWMRKMELGETRVAIKDHAGSLIIHVSSTIIGLTGALFLGRRLVRMRSLDPSSIGQEMVVGTLAGYFLLIIGYTLFGMPTPHYLSEKVEGNYAGVVVVNSIMAMGTGTLTVILLHAIFLPKMFKYWSILRCIQGGIAGLISVSAAVDIYSPLSAAGLAIFCSCLFFFFAVLIHHTGLEDSCNITASHLVPAFIGILACPLLASGENFGESVDIATRAKHFAWQLISLIIVICFTTIFALLLFTIFFFAGILRNKYEWVDHRMATIVKYNLTRRTCIERLFRIDDDTPHIEPGCYRDTSIFHIQKGKHAKCPKTIKFVR